MQAEKQLYHIHYKIIALFLFREITCEELIFLIVFNNINNG